MDEAAAAADSAVAMLAAALSGNHVDLCAAAAASARQTFTEEVVDKLLSGGVQGARRLLLAAFEHNRAVAAAAPGNSAANGGSDGNGYGSDDHAVDLLNDPLACPAAAMAVLLSHARQARAKFEKQCARVADAAARESAAFSELATEPASGSVSADIVAAWSSEVDQRLMPEALGTLASLLQTAAEQRQLSRQQARASGVKAVAISEAREGLLRQVRFIARMSCAGPAAPLGAPPSPSPLFPTIIAACHHCLLRTASVSGAGNCYGVTRIGGNNGVTNPRS